MSFIKHILNFAWSIISLSAAGGFFCDADGSREDVEDVRSDQEDEEEEEEEPSEKEKKAQ